MKSCPWQGPPSLVSGPEGPGDGDDQILRCARHDGAAAGLARLCYPEALVAQVLISGKAREILAGGLPPGVSAEEVDSLAKLQSRLDGKGGTLVLADTAHLESDPAGLDSWIQGGGNRQAVVVAVVEPQEREEVLKPFSFVDDLPFKPVTPSRMRLRLDRCLDSIHNRRVIHQLDGALLRKSEELHELNKIGV